MPGPFGNGERRWDEDTEVASPDCIVVECMGHGAVRECSINCRHLASEADDRTLRCAPHLLDDVDRFTTRRTERACGKSRSERIEDSHLERCDHLRGQVAILQFARELGESARAI